MGGLIWSSKSQYSDTQAQSYYNSINLDESAEGPKSKVQISISIRNADVGYDYIAYILSGENVVGRTELVRATSELVTFNSFFVMDYYFEKRQNLTYRIMKGNTTMSIETTLGSVMGARGQTLVKKLDPYLETLMINGQTLECNNLSVSMTFSMVNESSREDSVFYIIKKCSSDIINSDRQGNLNKQEPFSIVYKSEVVQAKNYVKCDFNSIKIPSNVLSDGQYESPILISLHSFTNHVQIGELRTTLNKLLMNEKAIKIGDLSISVTTKLIKEYSFLDYLRGGMQMALTVGIDFTASNLAPNDRNSLHYINGLAPNDYEKAIKSCGEIVAYYDYDGLFPVYGYGANLPGIGVSHCFPINFNWQDANISGIDGILNTYRECLHNIKFNGPTLFAPLIEKFLKDVESEKNKSVYYILMILTDGMINDMDRTIDALVEASFKPVSVIIIGIGRNDFGNMDVLDADETPLVDSHGRKAARDLVQFVPFYKFQNDEKLLSSKVLEEIPQQVVEYYRLINMPPGDPIVN